MQELIKRLKNPGTIISIVSAILLILTAVGVKVNNETIMTIVQTVLSIGVAVGVLNNPTTPGVYVPLITTGTTTEPVTTTTEQTK